MEKHQKEKKNRLNLKKIRMPELKPVFRLLLYGVTLVSCALSLMETAESRLNDELEIAVYTIAACGLAFSIYYLFYDTVPRIRRTGERLLERYTLLKRIYKDYHYRTVLLTNFSFLLNLLYGLGNGLYGLWIRSAWMVTLGAYYMILSIMRLGIARYGWKHSLGSGERDRERELAIYRNTGIWLLATTIVLDGEVVLLIHKEGGKSYPGTLVLAVAAYTFYKVIMSVVHMWKAGRTKSPLLVSIRNIGYVDALVSLLSLQTAMLSFTGNGGLDAQWMSGATGIAVCAMVSAIGIYMIVSYHKQKKQLCSDKRKKES